MAQVTSLNEARKRRAGQGDTGRCECGRYRVICRNGCLDTAADRMIEGLDELYAAAISRQRARRDYERRNALHR